MRFPSKAHSLHVVFTITLFQGIFLYIPQIIVLRTTFLLIYYKILRKILDISCQIRKEKIPTHTQDIRIQNTSMWDINFRMRSHYNGIPWCIIEDKGIHVNRLINQLRKKSVLFLYILLTPMQCNDYTGISLFVLEKSWKLSHWSKYNVYKCSAILSFAI